MIFVKLNQDNFEYDIYSLVKAFYPKEEVQISSERPSEGEISFSLVIEYSERLLRARLTEKECLVDYLDAEIDYSNRSDTKNVLKRVVYQLLSRRTGQELPWGTLTGIRPTKIALGMLEAGQSDENIRAYMKDTYFTTDSKIDLCLEISHREHSILETIDLEGGYSIYIGIPFCPSTCLYCSFTSYPVMAYQDRVDRYIDCLEKELRFVKEKADKNQKKLTTIYIGGGTPTSLDEQRLERLLGIVGEIFETASLLEYTIEAGRPDSITKEKLQIIKKYGISRISINPQTMNQKTLKLIGRHHTVEDIYKVFGWARETGLDNINMDLILGLPDENLEDVKYTLREIRKFAPESLTVHSLALKRSSRLNIDQENYDNYIIENSQAHMDEAAKCAKELGLVPYYLYRQKNIAANLENIGYAAPGREGIYNILIMEEKQTIIAVGAGCSCKYVKDGGKSITRSENVKDVDLYIERIEEMIDRKVEGLENIGWH